MKKERHSPQQQERTVKPADLRSNGDYASGRIRVDAPGQGQQFQAHIYATGIPASSGDRELLSILCVEVNLSPQDPGDPEKFIWPKDRSIGNRSTQVPLAEPVKRVKWAPAIKRLVAESATALLASLCTDEIFDRLTAAATQEHQERAERKRRDRLRDAEVEAAREQVRQESAAALTVATARWEELRRQGFTGKGSGVVHRIPWNKSINDQISLLLDALGKMPKGRREIGLFRTAPLSKDMVLCRVPVPTKCIIKTSAPWDQPSQVTVSPYTVEVRLTREGVYVEPERDREIEAELNRGRPHGGLDGDMELLQAWRQIPTNIYGPALPEKNATIHAAMEVLEGILHGPDFLRAVQHTSEFLRRTGLHTRGQSLCYFCRRQLKDQNSLWRGIGPDCWKRIVAAYPDILTDDLTEMENRLPKPLAMGEETVLQLQDGLKKFPALMEQPIRAESAEETVQRLVEGGWKKAAGH